MDLHLFAEAYAAGRDVGPFEQAVAKWCERLAKGKSVDAAFISAKVRWRELGDESWTEVKRCNQVVNTWMTDVKGPEVSRRARFLAKVCCRTQRALLSHGGPHTVHWQAMRMRRLVHLLGVDGAYDEKIKREAEQAAERQRRAAERKATKV